MHLDDSWRDEEKWNIEQVEEKSVSQLLQEGFEEEQKHLYCGTDDCCKEC